VGKRVSEGVDGRKEERRERQGKREVSIRLRKEVEPEANVGYRVPSHRSLNFILDTEIQPTGEHTVLRQSYTGRQKTQTARSIVNK
jgi:hypothetical protein